MVGIAKICLIALAVGTASAQRRGVGKAAPAEADSQRDGRSLVNTFPFNARNNRQQNHRDHDHHGHHEHHAHDHSLGEPVDFNRDSRQGSGDDLDLSIGNIAAAGERCIDKVVMVEETEYDDHVTCKHSYSERCHTTYTTDFEPQQEEDCEENFRKNCFIEYKKVAVEETVQKCNTPLTYEETGEGCKKVTQSVCTTRFHEHDVEDDVVECQDVQDEKCEDVTQGYTTEQKCTKWPRRECSARKERVTKYTPETECKPIVLELCGPELEAVSGEEECFDEKQTVVQEVPEETCNLEPQRECKHVTKLVPFLKPAEECVDIPKEVCSRSRRNPRKVQKPVVKKWCYVPTAESGLA